MIGFQLNEEQRMIQEAAREFAQKEIAPVAAKYDEEERHPDEVVKKAYEAGLLNLSIPEEYGGAGLGHLETVLVTEEFAAACAGITTTLQANILASLPILLAGSEEQKKKWLGFLTSGPHLAAFCLTEPGAGSDVSSIRTTAVRKGDKYVLTGTKQFITNGGVADLYTVFATVDRKKGRKGITAFVVPRETPGLKIGKAEKKMGHRASNTAEVIFEEVEVPVENRLGEEGEGFKIAMHTLDFSRPGVAALGVGVARAAFEAALEYATQRVQFGQPIAMFQAIQFKLADMAMKVETARLITWKAAWLADAGLPNVIESSMAKAYATDAAMWVTTEAVQIFGGYGYTKEYPVEKYMRDAKLLQIYEGTNEIQRIVIARQLLKRFFG